MHSGCLSIYHPEIQQLKLTISKYFAIKQMVKNARDNRYLPWLVSIMNRRIFPDNVKIISWNYDFQVELAMGQIGQLEDINYAANVSL
jgi:hypothetical protein